MFIKSAIVVVIASIIAWLLYPYVFSDTVSGQVIFTLGILFGTGVQAIVLIILSSIKPKSVPGSVYVGNLAYSVSEEDVRRLFEKHGQVYSVRLMRDRVTGKMRGFGFVEMNIKDTDRVISIMNGMEFAGRKIKVNSANEKKDYPND